MVSKPTAPATADSDDSEPRGEVVQKTDWSAVQSWDEMLAHFGAEGGLVQAADAFGDGSELIDDKNALVGVPFVVLEWREVTDVATNRKYVNVIVMLKNTGQKVRFNDGSSGVFLQCMDHTLKYERTGGIYCPRGLRKSEYTKDLEDGTKAEATTFYFA